MLLVAVIVSVSAASGSGSGKKKGDDLNKEDRAMQKIKQEAALASKEERQSERLAKQEAREEKRADSEDKRLERKIEQDEKKMKKDGSSSSSAPMDVRAAKVEQHLLKEAARDERNVEKEERKAERMQPVKDEQKDANSRGRDKKLEHQIDKDLVDAESAANTAKRDSSKMAKEEGKAQQDDKRADKLEKKARQEGRQGEVAAEVKTAVRACEDCANVDSIHIVRSICIQTIPRI